MRIQLGIRAALVSACLLPATGTFAAEPTQTPLGLPPVAEPADNPSTPAKVALGKQLYFDPRLSADNTVSCASCHDPNKGWSNGLPFGVGVGGKQGGRNTPTIVNAAYARLQFWDGRATELEGQAVGPIANPIEMNLPLDQMEKKLNAIEGYRTQFRQVFDSEVTAGNVAKAIAAFERTVLSGNAPYDRFKAGDDAALSPAAKRGLALFTGKAQCSACHTGHSFTDFAFHNIGVGMDKPEPDVGREAISKLAGDRGAFRTPTLREIAKTAPYMHDGSLKTLEEVVEYYDKGGIPNDHLDEEMAPLKLTPAEKADLVVFLKEGTASPDYPHVTAPELPK